MLYGEKNCEEAQIEVVERYIGVVQSNTKTTLHAQFQQIKINSPIPLEICLTFSMLEGTAVGIRWHLISCPDTTISFCRFIQSYNVA